MTRKVVFGLIAVLVLFSVVSCGAPSTPEVIEKVVVETKEVEVVITATPAPKPEPVAPPMPFSEALACVEEHFPAEAYFTNEYLPDPTAEWVPLECESFDQLKVGMPWILNDEEAPWYNAVELGFFADMCITVELLPGGPGRNYLQLLGTGEVDIVVQAGGIEVPRARASRTPIELTAVGTFLKDTPYVFLTVREDLVSLGRELTPWDVADSIVATQNIESNPYIPMLVDTYGIPREAVKMIDGGFNPDAILAGKADFFTGWIMNQTRWIEKEGFEWNGLMWKDWMPSGYSDVTVVQAEMLETAAGQDLLRRYLAAETRGLVYLLEHPEESAAIAAVYAAEQEIQEVDALRRFELQEELVIGTDGLPLRHMRASQWNEWVASLYQFGQIEIPGCE